MAKTTVAQIARRAKKIRKKGEAWASAIKRASKQLKGGARSNPSGVSAAKKKGAAVSYKPRKKLHQTGSSSAYLDKKLKAKAPGKRKSRSGRIYYEYRKNRSDMPGTLTGISAYQHSMLTRINSNLNSIRNAEERIAYLKHDMAKVSLSEKRQYRAKIAELKKYIKALQSDNAMLKRLIK